MEMLNYLHHRTCNSAPQTRPNPKRSGLFQRETTMPSANSKSSDEIMVFRVDSTWSVYLGAVPFRNRWCCWGRPLAWPLRMILWDDKNSKLLQEQTVEYDQK